jgi:N-acetylneuraminic acid mutarotase
MRASISFVSLSRRAAVLMLVLFMAAVTYAQITPSDDAYVNSALPTTNYGTATTLNLSSPADTAFIRFDLTAVPTGYTGASIAKATLKLYVNTVTTAGSFNVDLVNGTWTEKKIDYSNEPALGTAIVASVPLTLASKGTYVEIDITPAMVAWLNNTQPNDGIALVANSPLVATFDSKENTAASHAPEVDIVFAGGGTITGVTTASGSGLIGGGTSGTLNLSLTNACVANQVLQWNGTAWACANSSGGGTVTAVGLTAPSTDFIVTGSPVTTSGTLGLGWLVAPDFNNTPNAIVKRDSSGNFSAGTINAATGFNLGGAAFAFGSTTNANAFLGFAGNGTMTGNINTASGYLALAANTTGNTNTASGAYALEANTTGIQNTASGVEALTSNTTGGFNTASGFKALLANTTGNNNTASGTQALYYNTGGANNTALGYSAGPDQNSANLTNATAIGAYAVVSESNALVLGGTGGYAVSVGIGTAKPAYTLDVQGSGRFTQPILFAASQTFPGTGTLTGVIAGTDLTGGGSVGNVTLNLDTSKVPQLAAANTFTATQAISGNLALTGSGHGVQFADGTLQTTAASSGSSCYETSSVSPIIPIGYTALGTQTAGNLWFPVAPMPTARSYLAAAVGMVSGIYAIGGYNGTSYLNTVEIYDVSLNHWSSNTLHMPTARGGLAAVFVNGNMYAIGGYNGTSYLNTVEFLDRTGGWNTAAPMPTARGYLAAAAVNGLIYVIGGYNGTSYLNTVEVYNPVSNSWSTAAPLPTTKGHLAATAVNGLIYAIGGFYAPDYVYNPSSNSWSHVADMPTATEDLAAATVNGLIYAIGGKISSVVSTVQIYDPSSNSWSTAASMPTARGGLAAVASNVSVDAPAIYAIGGATSTNTVLNVVEQYSPPVTIYTFIKN